MAQKLKRLTPRKITAISKPGRHADGGGLYLVVTPSGTKQWAFMWKRDGKRREMGLGALHSVSLAKARALADEARAMVAEGQDPIAVRRRSQGRSLKAQTFGQCADDYLKTMRPTFRGKKHAAQWALTFQKYCAPIRNIPVEQISTTDVLHVLQPIWTRIPETASRVRGRIERVLDAAKAMERRSGENPARWRGHLDHLLPSPKERPRGHYAALAHEHIPAFMDALRQRPETSARLLEFIILTSVRLKDAREATWREINLDAGIWIIPAHRHKSKSDFRLPLTDQALAILRIMGAQSGCIDSNAFVFPGRRKGRPTSETICADLLERMGTGHNGEETLPWSNITTHGFRSTFRDWAGDLTSFPREIAELALAHTIGDQTERAYRRRDAIEKRRDLMQQWADYLDQNVADNVIALTGGTPS